MSVVRTSGKEAKHRMLTVSLSDVIDMVSHFIFQPQSNILISFST